jgi:flagellar basal body-associated protein FliL
MALSKDEIESIRHENHKTEHKVEKGTVTEKPKIKINKKIILISIVSVVFVLIVGGIGFSYINTLKPAPLDGFAQCLTDKGAVMYGASFCQYSHAQQGMFGNSKKYLDIRDFSEDSNVKTTPTWLINGEYFANVQTFDRLASLTGCELGQ